MALSSVGWLFPGWLSRLPSGCGGIALTFDDGPDPRTTPLLLSALDRLAISCTHFVTGSKCVRAGSLLAEARSLGHAIENHGYEHSSLLFATRSAQRDSIRKTDDEVRRYAGSGCRWFRPPFGRFNPWTAGALRELSYRGVLWSAMPRDWSAHSEEELWQRLVRRLREGDIVVLHDGQETTPLVIRMLPRLADEAALREWKFLPLPAPTHNRRV